MNRIGTFVPLEGSPRRRGSPPRLLLAVAAVVLLIGCAPGGEQDTAPEETDVSDVGQEQGGPETAEDPGGEVAVDLPGLPIGGSAEFTAAGEARCVDVTWSAATLVDGVAVEIGAMAAPGFQISEGGCEPPLCLDGFRFTAASTGCRVAVTWVGAAEGVGGDQELGVTRARLTCVEESLCVQALAVIDAVGPTGITLTVPPTAPSSTGSS